MNTNEIKKATSSAINYADGAASNNKQLNAFHSILEMELNTLSNSIYDLECCLDRFAGPTVKSTEKSAQGADKQEPNLLAMLANSANRFQLLNECLFNNIGRLKEIV